MQLNHENSAQAILMEEWLIEPTELEKICALVRAGVEAEKDPTIYRKEGTVAIIPIKGLLMKRVPEFMAFYGIHCSSYTRIVANIKDALEDPTVHSIRLDVSSPGGTVPGIVEAAEAIFQANKEKPVHAFVDTIATSAAYWLASQASTITAEKLSTVGSIGVFTVAKDYSAYFEEFGIKVHVIKSGEHKGVGVLGAKITETQLESMKENIMVISEEFNKAVSKGRKLPMAQVKELATGRSWIAETAIDLKLIDALAFCEPEKEGSSVNAQTRKENEEMPDEKIEQQASISALKAAFPGDLEFAVEQFEAGATVLEAKAAYSDRLKTKLDESEKHTKALEEENSKLKAKEAEKEAEKEEEEEEEKQAKAKAREEEAFEGVTHGKGGFASPGDFIAQAKALAEEKNIKVTEAMRQISIEKPEVHASFIDEMHKHPIKKKRR